MEEGGRRRWLACFAATALWCLGLAGPVQGQGSQPHVIEVRIEKRAVVEPAGAIRVTEGEQVELRWSGDEAAELHIHGYDLTVQLRPGAEAVLRFEARASGRFPVTSHGWGGGGHGHDALTYLEVYPR